MPALRNAEPQSEADMDCPTAGDDSQGRFRIYRLCECPNCEGEGEVARKGVAAGAPLKCHECRGEGKVRERVAECPDERSLGVALVTLGREGEFADCPIGILDTEGEVGQKWLVNPWLPSTRNVRDAARLLGQQRRKGEASG